MKTNNHDLPVQYLVGRPRASCPDNYTIRVPSAAQAIAAFDLALEILFDQATFPKVLPAIAFSD